MRHAARLLGMALVIAAATWLIGWYAVPVVALVAGVARMRPGLVGLAASLGWLALLIIDALSGIARLGSVLSGIMGLPAPALFAVTLIFPALLAWSAASVAKAALDLRLGGGARSVPEG
jgi:hypothetical protein